jgi:hypothetical protein
VDAIEDGSRHLEAEGLGGDAEVRFEHLAHIHTTRHAERIETDIHRRSIRQEWHVFLWNDPRNNAFVPMTASHLVTDGELAFRGNEDFDLLDDPRINVVTAIDFLQRTFVLEFEFSKLVFKLTDDFTNLVPDR